MFIILYEVFSMCFVTLFFFFFSLVLIRSDNEKNATDVEIRMLQKISSQQW